jgi:uncharacterized protein (DUF1778 family)
MAAAIEVYALLTYIRVERFAMPRTAQRPDRISLRVGRDAKRKLERAAAYSDKTLTDFIIDVALQRADAIVRQNEVITLTRAEWDRFQDMLLNPPEPNKRLKKALAEHARVVRR